MRWPASGLGSVPVTDDDGDGNTALADVPTPLCTSVRALTLTSRVDDDESASGIAFTGKNVILILRLGMAGARGWTTVSDCIGGGSCRGNKGKNAKFGFLAGTDGGGDTTAGMAGSIRNSGGSEGGLAIGRVSGDAVGVGVWGWGSGSAGGSDSVGDWGRRGRRRMGTASR